MSCLFIGMKKSKLRKGDLQILDNWKDGVQQKISTDFIAYIPNYLLAGSVGEVGKAEVSNKCPHMTLLLKGKASAVESNSLLELISEQAPALFKNRSKRVIILDIPYGKVSKSVILINTAF